MPDRPIIPFIEGDGTGPDIWRASVRVLDAAVAKAYGGQRKIEWMEVLICEETFNATGNWLPDSTVDACRDYVPSQHQSLAEALLNSEWATWRIAFSLP